MPVDLFGNKMRQFLNLVKVLKYDWMNSNLALFGSDAERSVKKESAKCEPAWRGAGQKVGLQIWRIVKFKVEHWPKEDYGKFYDGDSYIILNTYHPHKNTEELCYDVHFWIGTYSSQDEYGTAAYKTVELDTYLDDKPVQHREVMNHESELFKSYFPGGIVLMKGGADTGFKHVEPEKYRPRLLLISGARKNIAVREVPRKRSKLTSDGVFILDCGLEIYQLNGSSASKDAKFRAAQFLQQLRSDRNGRASLETLEEDSMEDDHAFYASLNEEEEDEEEEQEDTAGTPKLFRVDSETGTPKMDLVKEGEIGSDDLSSKDVFVVDVGNELFVWVGKSACTAEKRNAIAYAHGYLVKSDHPLIPVSIFGEGHESPNFKTAMAA